MHEILPRQKQGVAITEDVRKDEAGLRFCRSWTLHGPMPVAAVLPEVCLEWLGSAGVP